MHWNMKKKLGTAGSLIALSSFANADITNAQIRNLDNRVTALEQSKGNSGNINPSARPQVKNGADLFIFGDLLFWKGNEGGLPLAVINKKSANNLAHSKVENLDGRWDFALRVGVGYDVPHDGWDLNFSWLRYNSFGRPKHIRSYSEHYVFPTLAPAGDPIADNSTCTKAKGRWRVLLNQLDLDLGREFYVSKWLVLRPHTGVRTDWIFQKVKADYKNFTKLASPNEVEVKYRDRWWGIGLEGGLDTQWGLGGGWGIFANLTTAVLYGEHRVKTKDENEPAYTNTDGQSSEPEGIFARVRDKSWIAHPILDMQIGLQWDWMLFHDHLHIGIQLGWENHIYFSQNQFPRFCDDFNLGEFVANQGDLSLEGWTLGVRLDF